MMTKMEGPHTPVVESGETVLLAAALVVDVRVTVVSVETTDWAAT